MTLLEADTFHQLGNHWCYDYDKTLPLRRLISTLAAEVHLIVLRENLCALGDDSSELNQSIQVNLSQLTHFILHGQLIDPHIDLLELVGVV